MIENFLTEKYGLIVSVVNPPEGILSNWWKTNYEGVDFFEETMQENYIGGEALSAEGTKGKENEVMLDSQLGTHPMKVQENKQLLNSYYFLFKGRTRTLQSKGSYITGNNHVPHGFSPCTDKVNLLTCNQEKCCPISYAKIVNQLEPVFCSLGKKRKATYDDAEMDPEIQHLIETFFWKIDNFPLLLDEITNKVKDREKATPPKKLRRVVNKFEDLF